MRDVLDIRLHGGGTTMVAIMQKNCMWDFSSNQRFLQIFNSNVKKILIFQNVLFLVFLDFLISVDISREFQVQKLLQINKNKGGFP